MSTRTKWVAAGVALAALGPILLLRGAQTDGQMRVPTPVATVAVDAPVVHMRKNPGCGCCDDWAKHMEAHGFRVESREDPGIYEHKQALGIPRELVSCHTAEVDGYVIEGHVPADLVQRMLRERPAIVGIAVGGMPMGSPGMEGPYTEPYDVVAFRTDGTQMVYASR